MHQAKNIFLSIHHSKNTICHTSNIIYPITCENYGTQYVGETANELHLCMNLHRRSKTGYPHVTEHFNSFCKGKSYSVQIIEVFSGNSHDKNDIEDKNNYRLKLGSEDFWMKTLSTNFPYGLNERSKDLVPGASIGTDIYPIGRSGERNNKCHKNRNSLASKASL